MLADSDDIIKRIKTVFAHSIVSAQKDTRVEIPRACAHVDK